MGLFSKDHGESLLAEFENAVSTLKDRVSQRRDVVKLQLAELQSEHAVLTDLDDKLAPHAS